MTYLVDSDYLEKGIDPELVNPSTFNVRLKTIRRMKSEWRYFIMYPDFNKQMAYWSSLGRPDVKNPEHRHLFFENEMTLKPGVDHLLVPNEYALFSAEPRIHMLNGQAGFLFLRSGDARGGANQFNTIIDSGFEGDIVLEVMNHAPWPKYVRGEQQVAQIFTILGPEAATPYQGSYQGQRGAEPPR